MFTVAALLLVANAVVSTASSLDGRIVGGSDADIESYPWQLSLQVRGGHICGAVIVSTSWALTAAHCVDFFQVADITLRSGSSIRGSGGTLHQAQQILIHDLHIRYTDDYDIAALLVSPAFLFGPTVSAVTLPPSGSAPPAGTPVTVTGWGHAYDGGTMMTVLQQTSLVVQTWDSCVAAYTGLEQITERMLCAAAPGRDACQGDSGGPLVLGNVLVGLVSHGEGCADPSYPGVFADIGNLRDWIFSTTGS